MPAHVRDMIASDAETNNRSLNSEIVERLSGATIAKTPQSLRDWFAGQALAGLISSSEAHFRGDLSDKAAIAEWRAEVDRRWAGYCYEMADAMLAAREGGAS